MATLATNISFQCLRLDGKPLAGGKVWTYEAGTTIPKTTYTIMQGNVPNSNPVILDQNGKAKIYLGDGSYRLRILDSNDALIDDIDQISRYVTQSEFAAFQQTVNDGVAQLTEVREQIDVYVDASIGDQKGFAGGLAPLDDNVKVPHVYLPDIVNNTYTNDPSKILSAAMGENLQDQIANVQSWMFGIGQSWQNVTSSRSLNTTYTNSTGRPIVLNITARDYQKSSLISVTTQGVTFRIGADSHPYDTYAAGSVIIASGATYSIAIDNASLETWHELRN